jgi:hypothetical protein
VSEVRGARGGGALVWGESHHQRQTALREMDHGRVEIGPLVECRHDHAAGKGSRDLQQAEVSIPGASKIVAGAATAATAAEACLPRRTTRTASSSVGLRRQTDRKVSVVEV